jgi:methylenetetrahydrofolate reductase (NADPH)
VTKIRDRHLRASADESYRRLQNRPRATAAPAGAEVSVSFEFFPPQNGAASRQLWAAMERLSPLAPDFVSFTYGAGGSTRARTHDTVKRVLAETALVPAAHLTCVGASRAEIDGIADDYWQSGVRHIVALRGDPPEGGAFRPHPHGHSSAAELVEDLANRHDFDISVAAYPETHPEARSPEADLDNLKRKIDAGARRAITQFFFDADTFLRFRDRAAGAGIHAPIIPGILPVTNFARLRDFAARCGASVPDWIGKLFEDLDDAPDIRQLVSATVTAELCTRLVDHGVSDFHFYTLNRSELTLAICRILGVYPQSQPESRTTAQL